MFSGDVGPRDEPLIRDVELLTQTDLVVLESTCGGRDHKSLRESSQEELSVIQQALDLKGKILTAAFAVCWTQELRTLPPDARQTCATGGVRRTASTNNKAAPRMIVSGA